MAATRPRMVSFGGFTHAPTHAPSAGGCGPCATVYVATAPVGPADEPDAPDVGSRLDGLEPLPEHAASPSAATATSAAKAVERPRSLASPFRPSTGAARSGRFGLTPW